MQGRLVYLPGRDPYRARSGHDNYVRAHVRAAREAGFEPLRVCAGVSDGWETSESGSMLRVASGPLDHRNLHAPAHTAPLVRALLRTRTLRRGDGPVLFHGFGLWTWTATEAADAFRRRGLEAYAVGSMYTAHEHEVTAKLHAAFERTDPVGWGRALYEHSWTQCVVNPCERRACTRATRIYVNYRSVARALARRCGRRIRVERLPYASERAFEGRQLVAGRGGSRARSSARDVAPLVLAVSRHAGNKGLDVLIRALAGLRAQGVTFKARLVGGGPLLPAHSRLAAQLGLADAVELTGEVDDVEPHLTSADLFVLPSLQEGSGSVSMLEALEASLPVVASAVDGIVEDVTHEQSGLLVPPGDPVALAGALRRVLESHRLRRRLTLGARALFEARFAPARFVSALGDAYTELGLAP